MEPQENYTLADFPEAILLRIFQLGCFSEEGLERLAYVCKRFRDLAYGCGLHSDCRFPPIAAEQNFAQYNLLKNAQSGRFKRIRSLIVQGHADMTCVTDEAIHAFGASCPLLEEVRVYGCKSVRGHGIASILASCSGLKSLHVNACELKAEDISVVYEALMGEYRPRTMPKSGGLQLSDELNHSLHKLRTLNLTGNKIGSHGAFLLSSFLSLDPLLSECYLFHNEIGSKGVIALANALPANTHLKLLDLGANYTEKEYISAAAVQELISSMDLNHSIEKVGFGMNAPFTQEWAEKNADTIEVLRNGRLSVAYLATVIDLFNVYQSRLSML